MKYFRKIFPVVKLLLFVSAVGFAQIENLLPTEPSLFIKFSSFSQFQNYVSNLVKIMFPKSYDQTMNSLRSFFEENLRLDILENSNLQEFGLSTNREFGFGFNAKGQPFIILPVVTTNFDERITLLQNTLYKLNFSSFTFAKDYIIATGKEFESSKLTSSIKTQYNLYINNSFLDSLVPFKIPIKFSSFQFLAKVNDISSNKISLSLFQHPVVINKVKHSSKLENIPYTFQKDNVSLIVDLKFSPQDLITNIVSIENTVDLGIYKILTNFEKEFEIDLTQIITNLVGPSTFFIYGYNNPLNNKIMFVSPVIEQNSFIRVIDKMTREIAKKRDVFKFTVFDKSFYRLPIKENYSIYFGTIFNRFIVSSDRDTMIGFIRNLANNIKEMEGEENSGSLMVLIRSQPTLNNTVKISISETHPFIRNILPLIVQSDKIRIISTITNDGISSLVEINY
ncbi:MAG: hypothetical protein ABDH28_02530 [Brevinematia bacterium]